MLIYLLLSSHLLLQWFPNFDVPCNYLGSLKNTNASSHPRCSDLMCRRQDSHWKFVKFQVILMSDSLRTTSLQPSVFGISQLNFKTKITWLTCFIFVIQKLLWAFNHSVNGLILNQSIVGERVSTEESYDPKHNFCCSERLWGMWFPSVQCFSISAAH